MEDNESVSSRLYERSIRLLSIVPGQDEGLISCTVKIYSLDNHPQYKALSYVCGEKQASTPIQCGGRSCVVTQNLYDAMLQLRSRDIQGLLWIDAISINQEDAVEKSSQVAMMRDIFMNATQVIVWAGLVYDDAELAFKLLERLKTCVQLPLQNDKYGTEDLSLQQNSLPRFEDPPWRALWSFLSRPLFTRIWIVQELVVFASSITLCGNLSIETETVLAGTAIIRYFTNIARAGESQLSEHAYSILSNGNVINMLRNRRLDGTALPLASVVSLTKYHGATDERDMIFALVGIASDQPVVLIDYTDSLRTCIVQYAKYGLLRPKEYWVSLDMLSNVSSNREELELPSWVPDIKLNIHAFRSLGTHFYSSHLGVLQSFHFDGDTGEILATRGLCIDTISDVVASPYTLQPATASVNVSKLELVIDALEWETKCRSIASLALRRSVSSDELMERYWRCLIFDMHNFSRPAPHGLGESFFSWMQLLLARKQRLEDTLQESDEDRVRAEELNETLFINAMPFMTGLQNFGMGRRFMSTSFGSIGWVPESAKHNDNIFLLEGCKIPYVFREISKGSYTLLGGAYVDDQMDYQKGFEQANRFIDVRIV